MLGRGRRRRRRWAYATGKEESREYRPIIMMKWNKPIKSKAIEASVKYRRTARADTPGNVDAAAARPVIMALPEENRYCRWDTSGKYLHAEISPLDNF